MVYRSLNMSTIDDRMAEIVRIGGLNMDLPQQIEQIAAAQIALMGNTYQAIMGQMRGEFYVDQVKGSDTASGLTANTPFASIQKAVGLVPRGGYCRVHMDTNYTLRSDIDLDGRMLHILSTTGGRPNLFFDRFIDTNRLPILRRCYGFTDEGGGQLALQNIAVNVPVLDSDYSTITPYNFTLFNSAAGLPVISVSLYGCALVIPVHPFCALFPHTTIINFLVYDLALTGPVQSLNGVVSAAQPNTAGVATASLPWIVTNLATI
jgi:hypothetical protein